MIILTIRTDKPEAELGLYNDDKQLAYETWQAHRQLAETIHGKIKQLLQQNNLTLEQLQGVVAFKGPGSFTGLRIGLSVANALAYGLAIPIVAANGDDWIKQGTQLLQDGKNDKAAMPEYGAAAHITLPRK